MYLKDLKKDIKATDEPKLSQEAEKRVESIIKVIENMSIEEFENALKKAGIEDKPTNIRTATISIEKAMENAKQEFDDGIMYSKSSFDELVTDLPDKEDKPELPQFFDYDFIKSNPDIIKEIKIATDMSDDGLAITIYANFKGKTYIFSNTCKPEPDTFEPTKTYLMAHKDEYAIELKNGVKLKVTELEDNYDENLIKTNKTYSNITKIYRLVQVWERPDTSEIEKKIKFCKRSIEENEANLRVCQASKERLEQQLAELQEKLRRG